MIQPPLLKKGDTVAIVATARKHLDDDLTEAKQLLESWGLKVHLGTSIGIEHHQLAGTDLERATDFQNQCENPEIKAIWCVRGGYGTVRMIDLVDFSVLQKKPKWLIGFSDVTVLHAQLLKLNMQSIHGFMAFNTPTASENAKKTLRQALMENTLEYQIPSHSMNRMGVSQGILVGGNLSVLYSLLGSKTAVDFQDKILFIEDLDEYLYHMDRMLINLKRGGVFAKIKGLIVGGMTQMRDSNIPWGKEILEVIQEHISDYAFPVVYDFPSGHIPDNRALIIGREVHVEVDASKSNLKFL
jgi:muramoyltetrapeptide carboxypeptidase